MPDVISIQDIHVTPHAEELAFEFSRDRGFARSGKAGQPDNTTHVPIAQLALASSDFALAPVNVVALGMRIVSSPRIHIGGNDAAAGKIITIDNHEPPHRGNIRMNIERNRFFGMQCQLSHFMTRDERLTLDAQYGLQARSIDDSVDRGDAAIDLARGQLELVVLAFGKRPLAQPKDSRFETGELERR